MKYLLIFILFGSCLVCKGQIVTGNAHYGFLGESLPAVDTEKVWFLVVDTTHMVSKVIILDSPVLRNYLLSRAHDTTYDFGFYSLHAKMIPGWIAEEKRSDRWNETFWMAAVAYLDEFKHPLSKNFMIWDSKLRK